MSNLNLVLIRGLPASGKTYYAKKLQKEYTKLFESHWLRTSTDEVHKLTRPLFSDPGFFPDSIEYANILSLFQNIFCILKVNLILEVNDCDTSLNRNYLFSQIIKQCETTLKEKDPYGDYHINIIEDFTCFRVPLSICIERDLNRYAQVGKDHIQLLHDTYLKGTIFESPNDPIKSYHKQITPNKNHLPEIVICDIDGTLVFHNGRDPYVGDDCNTDTINQSVLNILKSINQPVVFITGRSEQQREQTVAYLEQKLNNTGIIIAALHMRPTDQAGIDDAIIKEEIYNREILGKYYPLLVLEDRPNVCQMYYDKGLAVFRTGDQYV